VTTQTYRNFSFNEIVQVSGYKNKILLTNYPKLYLYVIIYDLFVLYLTNKLKDNTW